MEAQRVYVEVNATFSVDGKMLPSSFIWRDGHEYHIQRITDVRRSASLKAGGSGMRYTCIIDGIESHLFHEDSNRWFVEGKR